MLPDGTNTLPDPILTNHQWGLLAFTWAISQEMLKISILIGVWKLLTPEYNRIYRGQWVDSWFIEAEIQFSLGAEFITRWFMSGSFWFFGYYYIIIFGFRVWFISSYYRGVPVMTPLVHPGLSLGLCPANERQRYFVTTSLIGWAQA